METQGESTAKKVYQGDSAGKGRKWRVFVGTGGGIRHHGICGGKGGGKKRVVHPTHCCATLRDPKGKWELVVPRETRFKAPELHRVRAEKATPRREGSFH